jgi:glycosyltransferase involved in cell wall biosynthesis
MRSKPLIRRHEIIRNLSLQDAVAEVKEPAEGANAVGRRTPITRRPRISVVLPAMNEAANLPHVLARMPTSVDEIVLVDGHSVDDTVAVARTVRPDIRVVMQSGTGKGNALACGFAASVGDMIVMLDADGSTDPAEIPRFVDALAAGADFAKGSRFLDDGGSADITPLRRAGNRVLCTVVNLLFGTRYTDLCYGYNAFWRDCLTHMDIVDDGFEVETHINVRLARSGLRIAEVPSYEHERVYGVSNLKPFRDGLRVLRTIIQQRFSRATPTANVLPGFHELVSNARGAETAT